MANIRSVADRRKWFLSNSAGGVGWCARHTWRSFGGLPAWNAPNANSVVMAKADITRTTNVHGIVKDAKGEPTGEHLAELHGLKSLLDIYGVTADRWDEYLELCRTARERGWWRAYGLDNKGYVPLEADASLVKDFNESSLERLSTDDIRRIEQSQ